MYEAVPHACLYLLLLVYLILTILVIMHLVVGHSLWF